MSQQKIVAEVGCTKTGVNANINWWKETGNVAERRGRKIKSNNWENWVLISPFPIVDWQVLIFIRVAWQYGCKSWSATIWRGVADKWIKRMQVQKETESHRKAKKG